MLARVVAGLVVSATMLLLASVAAAAGELDPTLQDLQLVARIIRFQDKPVSGSVRFCVVLDPGSEISEGVVQRVETLLRHGVSIGGIDLDLMAIPQDALGGIDSIDSIGAILATPGVDASLLRAALARLHVPCLTLDRAQLGSGGCMVAVQTDPAVSITLDQSNADAAGVHFATAFRMMVTEQ